MTNTHQNGALRIDALLGLPPEGTACAHALRRTAPFPDVAYVVLGHVRNHSRGIHGYLLGRLLSASAVSQPSLRLGQLYRLLRRLERARLVQSRIEVESARLRYRFTITAYGETFLEEWLRSTLRWSDTTCQQLLHRLQFADRLPAGVLRRLVDDTANACRGAIEDWRRSAASARARGCHATGRYEVAAEARLAADLSWLEQMQRLLQESAGPRTSSAIVSPGPRGRAPGRG